MIFWLISYSLLVFPIVASEKLYRVFDETSPDHVKEFYAANHAGQTLEFVLSKKREYLSLRRDKMGIWDAFALLETIVDESDPDLDLPQCYHAFQAAEALRQDGAPRWLILVGLIHDLGKMLTFYGEPQWAVVGDTFPLGCAFSDKIVFPDYFSLNGDKNVAAYQSECGIYTPGCGLDAVHMSWGHDEYLYHVVNDYLPEEASFIIRYHSFYALHDEGAYMHLLNENDKQKVELLKLFCRYDLYSKGDVQLDIDALMPYYRDLVNEFFPETINW